MVRDATAAQLRHNRAAQILCSLQSLAAASALWDERPNRMITAGYSVGEVAAWGVAGLLSMKDALDLVARRAEAMDAMTAPGDTLLFVRGLARTLIDRLCEEHDAAIAIVNPGEAFILGGARTGLVAIAAAAKAMNAARVVEIPVEVASHTPRLARAAQEFRDFLRQASVQLPITAGTRLLSGIDGAPVVDVEVGLDKLAAQVCSTVHWADCLQACLESGATRFLELGPGSALSEMLAGMERGIPVRSLEEFRTLQGARSWLRS